MISAARAAAIVIPTTDPDVWKAFCAMVQAEYDKGDFPPSWAPAAEPKRCMLTPPLARLEHLIFASG